MGVHLELELIQSHMAQKQVLRGEVGARVVGVHARTGGIHFLWPFCLRACVRVATKVAV